MITSDYKGDNDYSIECTGDACVGDEVRFNKATFTGSFRAPKFDGYELITGTIVSESYGKKTGQHTFTIMKADGGGMRIKGRNLYAEGLYRKPWVSEAARRIVLEEKHKRGDKARADKEARKCESSSL